MAGRLFKPVDPEHVSLSGCKASTFMGFFEGVVQKLIAFEREANPATKADLRSSDKGDDEEFMKKTADHNEPEPDSPKRLATDSLSKDEDGNVGLQGSSRWPLAAGGEGSTSRPRRNSSPNKVKKFKKMTDDVAAADRRS